MTTSQFQTDRRALLGTLGALTLSVSGASAASETSSETPTRKAKPPRGSYGIVMPGLKRTAFLNAPAGMSQAQFQDRWISAYAAGMRARGARSVIFNLIDKEHSPDTRFDAVTEIVFENDWAYEREYLNGHTAYTDEAEETKPSVIIVSRQIGIRDFDPALPIPTVKRFGLVRRKPELTTDTLALAWRNEHAPLFGANNYLRRYYVNLTDRTYAPDVPWDGYADIWWDDFASTKLRSDLRVPVPESDASEVIYMFMTPKTVI